VAKIDPIALHPLQGVPYDRLEFARMLPDRTPLYRVIGSDKEPSGAFKALGCAFERYGGTCFYCDKKFPPQPLAEGRAHRDHVVPASASGSDRLHNLVIACSGCGAKKANKPLHRFRPRASDAYLQALEGHIARALGSRKA
jgi:5-methylcytosine-specific restriction endonuclease McrA